MTIRTCCVYVCVYVCVFMRFQCLNLFASSSAEYTVRNSRSTLLGARHSRGTLTLVFLPLATFKPFLSCFSSKETFAAQVW